MTTQPTPKRKRSQVKARFIAAEHRKCQSFYRNADNDSHGINMALMVMHADTAAIWEKAAGINQPKEGK